MGQEVLVLYLGIMKASCVEGKKLGQLTVCHKTDPSRIHTIRVKS